jgi:hypothetical protein
LIVFIYSVRQDINRCIVCEMTSLLYLMTWYV